MKQISILIDTKKAVNVMRQEAANFAGRAELMGISGVFDVMPVVDEEVGMVEEWIVHTMHDLRVFFGNRLVGYYDDGDGSVTMDLSLPNNFPEMSAESVEGYCNKILVDELLLHWLRMCEAASTMKGVESPLGRQQQRVRDADFMLLKEAVGARVRTAYINRNKYNELG